jgi:type I restriction enzyme S subunit
MKRLDEVAEIVGGSTPKSSVPGYWGGDIPWVTPADLSKLDGHFLSDTPRKITQAGLINSGAKVLPFGSVLFSSRAPIGNVAITTIPMATNQGFKSLVTDATQLDSKFAYWWLRAHKAQLQELGVGVTFKEVSKSIVSGIEIPLPPLPEQRRIAEILDRVDALRAKRRQALTLLDELAESDFEATFDIPQTIEGLERLPRLAEFALQITDGEHQTPRRTTAGNMLLSARNVQNGYLDFDNVDWVDDAEFQRISRRCRPMRGDVLISCSGSVGRVSVVNTDAPFVLVRSVALVRPNEALSPIYLERFLRSASLQREIARRARSSAQANLFQGPIRDLPILVPSVEQQQNFERRMVTLEGVRATVALHLAKLEELFSSLQNGAFSGQL